MNFSPQFGHEDESAPDEPLDDRVQEALRQKEWLDELTRTRGWAILRQFVEEQCQRRVNEVMLTPAAATPEQSAQVNMTRGEYAGMQLVIQYVVNLHEQATAIINAFKEQR